MKIVFLGAGNLATNLAMALRKSGDEIAQVYSRSEQSASKLAHKTISQPITQLNRLVSDADIYFICVKDDVIEEVLRHFPYKDVFLVHTAGSVSMDVFSGHSNNFGVFYPLQTFTKEKPVDFSEVPICLEANKENNLKILKNVAERLSSRVHFVNTVQRLYLHVAAVFACNFTNYMFVCAENILNKYHIPFHVLEPLIKETVDKAGRISPSESQTGPAIRDDKQTLEKHFNLLSHSRELQNLYSFVSDSIRNYYRNNTSEQ